MSEVPCLDPKCNKDNGYSPPLRCPSDLHDQVYPQWGKRETKHHIGLPKDLLESRLACLAPRFLQLQVARLGLRVLQNQRAHWRGDNFHILYRLLRGRLLASEPIQQDAILPHLLHQAADDSDPPYCHGIHQLRGLEGHLLK